MRSSLTRPSPSSPQVIVEAVPDSFSGFPGQSKKPDGFMEAFFGPNPNKGKVRERRWKEKFRLTTCPPAQRVQDLLFHSRLPPLWARGHEQSAMVVPGVMRLSYAPLEVPCCC